MARLLTLAQGWLLIIECGANYVPIENREGRVNQRALEDKLLGPLSNCGTK
jgi:hypothetical protein